MIGWSRALTAAGLAVAAVMLSACNGVLPPAGVALLKEGEKTYRRGDYTATVSKMDQFVQSYGGVESVGEGYYLRGLALVQLKQPERAQRDLEQALSRARRLDLELLASVALGNLMYEQWQLPAAAGYYERVVERMPDASPKDQVLYRLGLCYERRGEWMTGKSWLSQVIQRFPNSPTEQAARRHLAASAYTIQCGAYSDFANATAQVERLGRSGLAARYARDAHMRFHLVQVGRYANYEQARSALAQVRGIVPDAIIVP